MQSNKRKAIYDKGNTKLLTTKDEHNGLWDEYSEESVRKLLEDILIKEK